MRKSILKPKYQILMIIHNTVPSSSEKVINIQLTKHNQICVNMIRTVCINIKTRETLSIDRVTHVFMFKTFKV